jgi:spore coat polysaccharide biosynthesis protein SpsF
MEALRRVSCDRHVLACPEDSAAPLEPLAAAAGFDLVPGSKEDVLGRYCAVIRRFGIDRVIRATADNPFVFIDAAEAINREGAGLGADYAGYSGLPCGAGVESVSAEALLRAEGEAAAGPDREHVCPYLYNHPELFLLHRPLAPRIWRARSVRITVDFSGDYKQARVLYDALALVPDREARFRGKTIIEVFEKTLGPAADCPPAGKTP